MENQQSRLGWMNFIGILLIIYAGISFLLEGWNNLNDLSKFFTYFGFGFVIYLLSEVFKSKTEDRNFNQILWILSNFSALAIVFQASSFLVDKMNPSEAKNIGVTLEPHTSVLALSLLSIFYYLFINYRINETLFKSFKAQTHNLLMASYAILALLPHRNSEFHLFSFLFMLVSSVGFAYYEFTRGAKNYIKMLMVLSPVLVFLGRIILYSQLDNNYTVLVSIVTLMCSIFLEIGNKNDANEVKGVGIALVSMFSIYEIIVNTTLINNKDQLVVILAFFNFLYLIFNKNFIYTLLLFALNFIYSICFALQINTHTIYEIIFLISISLAFVSSGYLLKNKARFLGYSGITIILIIGLISNEFENIQVNNSIVLGGIGLGFLMVRYLITNPKSKIMEIIASTKERFEDKNNQRLS